MFEKNLKKLVKEILSQKCEKQHLEIKKAAKGTPERLFDTFSSFANQSEGGTIIFGIDEKNGFELCGVYDAQDLQKQVANQALQMEPVVRPVFTTIKIEGKMVVSAEIAECDSFEKPCFYKGAGRLRGSFIRVGDADFQMTEYEIYSFETFKKKIRDELRTIERANLDNFDKNLLYDYFAKIQNLKQKLSGHSEKKILQLQGMTQNDVPTVAGLMLFCEYPQQFFPQLSVTAMVVDGTEMGDLSASNERFIDNKRIEGTIPQMLEGTLSFIRRNIKIATIIDENASRADKAEYPLNAMREIILNALIHRDYSIYTEDSPIRVVIYRNRLEIENPGSLYGRLTIADLGKMPGDTRNPFIAGAMEVLANTENRFSGIPTIYKEMEKANLPPPVFESRRGNFKVTLFNNAEKPEVIFQTENSDATLQQRILQFCKTPKSKQQIADFLKINSEYYVMTRYIKPLLQSGLLKLSMPEKPQSKNQMYFS